MIAAGLIDRARGVAIAAVLAERHLLAGMRRSGAEHFGPCPRCGGTDRFSFSTRKQCWNCRQCKPGDITGDAIGLIQWLDGVPFHEAVGILLGEKPIPAGKPAPKPKPTPKPKSQNQDDAERLRRAGEIWRASVPIASTPGELWLAARGIDIAAVPEHGGLRFHPHCPWEQGEAPCIVARFTDTITCERRGILRRPITIKEKPKALGPTAGCVVRLWRAP